jgi:hypothetical protein
MKKLILIFIATIVTIVAYSQEPADLPAGTTWGTARSWINIFKNASYDSTESHRNAIDLNYSFIQSHADSITKITDTLLLLRAPITNPVFIGLIKIGTDSVATLADLRSFQFSVDTTSLSARIDLKAPINNPTLTGLAKLNTDTLATQSYARTYGGTGTVTLGDVKDEIADSLNSLRTTVRVGDGTKGVFFDGTSDGGQLLKFYGDNGFWTALQGGAPIANRSYRLPIDALPSAGDSSLINIDQWGNMGFVPHNHYVKVADTINAEPGSYPSLWMFQQGMSNKVFVADSNKTFKGGYVTPKALMDSINLYAGGMTQEAVSNLVHDTISKYLLEAEPGVALGDSGIVYLTPEQVMDSIVANAGSAEGITLNGGTLTLSGGDALTFETGGDYSYTLPQTSGGTLMLMSEIQTAIKDSLDGRLVNYFNATDGLPANVLIGGTTLDASAEELNVLNSIPIGLTSTELGYNDGVTGPVQDQIDSLWQEVNDTISGSTLYRQLLDTTLYFAPVIGVGNAGDTAAFTLNNVIWGAKWGGSHSLVITKVTAVVAGTSPDIDLALLYDVNYKDGTPTEVFSSDLTVTSTTTGNDATISANDTIDPGEWIWLRVDQVTAKAIQCIINIYGHLK